MNWWRLVPVPYRIMIWLLAIVCLVWTAIREGWI